MLSRPAELTQGGGERLSSHPHSLESHSSHLLPHPQEIRESLAFDDLVFQDFNLLYFEIEIPEPARDPMLKADVLNFLRLQQLRKSIPLLYFLPYTTCQEARIQAIFVQPGAVCIPPSLCWGSDDINLLTS